jgi:methylated-DNA-[protein]-cysteine S-methyltransferase
MLSTIICPSPIGPLTLVAGDRGLRAILFPGEALPTPTGPSAVAGPGDDALLDNAVTQLSEYFGGRRRRFDVTLDVAGTPFQRRVWSTLAADVPYGSTTTYAELARRLGGGPELARAVGAANGRTPVPIVIPCHRVIGTGGALAGYRGGLGRKRALLALEGAEGTRQLTLAQAPRGRPGSYRLVLQPRADEQHGPTGAGL